jgi:electron transfer flavoprotein alpha subunit
MEKTLILLHTEAGGALPKIALEVLSLAAAPFTVAIVGEGAEAAAKSIGSCGAEKFLAVSGAAFAAPRYSTDAAAAEALIKASGATIVLAPCTPRWHRALPGVAERVGGVVDTHASAFDGSAVSRWFYRQRIEGSFTRAQRPWIILIDSGSAPAWSGAPAEVAVESIPVETGEVRTEVIGIETPAQDKQTIRPDAKLLFVAGAGWTKKQKDGQPHTAEAGTLIQGFVAGANCSLGSSKSLVDLSGEGEAVLPFLTHMHQVGQTGSTPRHPKGLATCCHGEEPHVVGWRFIGERRAVNLDPGCGWSRGKADVLYVADAFEVMRELNKLVG